jgi:hypothetical protein
MFGPWLKLPSKNESGPEMPALATTTSMPCLGERSIAVLKAETWSALTKVLHLTKSELR